MSENYGSDFITIVDEDGVEYELEILTTLEYNGNTYMAVIPAVDAEEADEDLEIAIRKALKNYFYKKTKQAPLIVVSVLEL